LKGEHAATGTQKKRPERVLPGDAVRKDLGITEVKEPRTYGAKGGGSEDVSQRRK